jgi:hypothetical protein
MCPSNLRWDVCGSLRIILCEVHHDIFSIVRVARGMILHGRGCHSCSNSNATSCLVSEIRIKTTWDVWLCRRADYISASSTIVWIILVISIPNKRIYCATGQSTNNRVLLFLQNWMCLSDPNSRRCILYFTIWRIHSLQLAQMICFK